MRTEIVYQEGKSALISGMKWQSLRNYNGEGKVTKDIRDKADLSSADKILIHTVSTEDGLMSSVGLYVNNDLTPIKVKNIYSLAVAFVQRYPENKNMVLALRFGETNISVIIIHNGIPVADEIKSEADAKKLVSEVLSGAMGESNYVVFSNDEVIAPNSRTVSEKELLGVCGKSSKLISLPPKKTLVLIISIVGLISVGIIYSVYSDHRIKERQLLIAKESAADPIAPYQAQLAGRIQKLGLDRSSIIETIAIISKGNVWSEGWMLQKIDCSVGKCITSWERQGGTTAALLSAYPNELLLVDSTPEIVKLVKTVPLKENGITSIENAEVMTDAYTKYVNTYQQWGNAGIHVTQSSKLEDFKIWPNPTSGELARLPKNVTLKARPVEVTVPLHLSNELIQSTPPGVWWNTFTLRYSPSDIEKRLTILFKGNTYVR